MKKHILTSLFTLLSMGAMAQTGTFKTAALNVDGMPKEISIAGLFHIRLNPDAKEAAGATAIGKKLHTMGYDVVGLSEDFNYHDEIFNEVKDYGYVSMTHRGEISVGKANLLNYPSKKPLFNIDGLGLFYNSATVTASNEKWTAWTAHNGYTDNGADGLIDKGFRYYTITLKDGVEVDLYILHMDAETTPADNAARATQIDQLVSTIKATDNKRPIIVMGDTNCRYTRDPLKTNFIDALNADPRFTCKDPWIEYEYNGIYPPFGSNSLMVNDLGYQKGEVVDKVFYINNLDAAYRIKAKNYLQDVSFVNEAGEPLADHWPIVIEWEYYPSDETGEHEQEPPSADNPYDNADGYYLRNVATGEYLKSGGWHTTHAMTGCYGEPIAFQPFEGRYLLKSPTGFVNHGADGPWMDSSDFTGTWNVVERNGTYSFIYNNGAETHALASEADAFAYGLNGHRVTTAAYDEASTCQQWELLTREELMAEMRFAREATPFDATFLIGDPEFSPKCDASAWSCDISSTAKKMAYNLSKGKTDHEKGNTVGEVYVEKYSGRTDYETCWHLKQEFKDLPNGRYKVSCQGFYRVKDGNEDPTGTAQCCLYARTTEANDNRVDLKQMFQALQQTDIDGGTTYNGYKYPNSMEEASNFFNAGHYPNEVFADVTDGKLTIEICKESTSKASSVWTCFDNFQLIYLGPTTLVGHDINSDGKLDKDDVTDLILHILGANVNVDATMTDVDGDGHVSISDATALIDILSSTAE